MQIQAETYNTSLKKNVYNKSMEHVKTVDNVHYNRV